MGILTTIFEEEFNTIQEELKDKIYESVIEYAAQKALSNGLITNPIDLQMFLESVGEYIDNILETDENIQTEDDLYLAMVKYTAVVDGIIEAVDFLDQKGILEAINWKKAALHGAGLALAGLGAYGAYKAYQDYQQHQQQRRRETEIARQQISQAEKASVTKNDPDVAIQRDVDRLIGGYSPAQRFNKLLRTNI